MNSRRSRGTEATSHHDKLIFDICGYQSSSINHYGRKGMKWYQHIFGDFEKGAAYAKKGLVKAGSKAIKTYKSSVNKVAEANQHRVQAKKEAKELRKKAAAEHKAIEKARKAPEQMTNEELKAATDRLKLMNEYNKQYGQMYPDPKAARRAAGKELVQLALKTGIEKGLPLAFQYIYEKNSPQIKKDTISAKASVINAENTREENMRKARNEKRVKTTKKIERLEKKSERLDAKRKTLETLIGKEDSKKKGYHTRVDKYERMIDKINKKQDKLDNKITDKADFLEYKNEKLWKKQKKMAKRQRKLNKLANK